MAGIDIKIAARRLLKEIFPSDDEAALGEAISEDFVNHEAPAGTPPGPGSVASSASCSSRTGLPLSERCGGYWHPGTAAVQHLGAAETHGFAAALVAALAHAFPDDPPTFVVAVPHGYCDLAQVAADLAAGGLNCVSA